MEFLVCAPEQPLCRAALGELPEQNGNRWGADIWSPTTTRMVQKKTGRDGPNSHPERRAALGGEQGQTVAWAVLPEAEKYTGALGVGSGDVCVMAFARVGGWEGHLPKKGALGERDS